MKENEFYRKLEDFEKGSFHPIILNRGNGEHKETVQFEGLDEKRKPLLYLEGGSCLDIEKIGGYDSIVSIE